MMGSLTNPRNSEPLWFGLGKDVRGICNICHYNRELIAQYMPEDMWVCEACFKKVFEEPAED